MTLLSIVIPVYNEKDTVREIVRSVESVNLPGIGKEIILVDDFSTDGTRNLLKDHLEGRDGIRILYHDRNRGKGAALRTGIAHTTGDREPQHIDGAVDVRLRGLHGIELVMHG